MAGGAACAGAAATASATTDWPHKKVTLIKPLVGRVRTPSCPLPADPAHVYGARVQKDSETAATLLSNWATTATTTATTTTTPEAKAAPQSWIRTNILALKHGNLTARAQRGFAKRYPSIVVPLKRVVGSNKDHEQQEQHFSSSFSSSSRAKALAASGFVFGKSTARNGETLKEVIGGRFAPGLLEPEADYPRGIVAVLAARLPKPRPTRGSQLLQATQAAQIARRAEREAAARTGVPVGGKLWTMPRWAKRASAKMVVVRGGGRKEDGEEEEWQVVPPIEPVGAVA